MNILARAHNAKYFAATALVTSSIAFAGAAEPQPGLWETTVENLQSPGREDAMKQLQESLSQLPPEKRKKFEAAAAARSIRHCLTAEDFADNKLSDDEDDERNCTSTVKSRTTTRWVSETICIQPEAHYESEVIFDSPTAYRIQSKGSITENGKTGPYVFTASSRYVGPDCSEVGETFDHAEED